MNFALRAASLSLLMTSLLPSSAWAQLRILAGTSARQVVVLAQDPLTEIVTVDDCRTVGSTPGRPVIPSPSAPVRRSEVFRFPPCRYPLLGGGYRAMTGEFFSDSANDVGTYTVQCTNLRDNFISCAPLPAGGTDACGNPTLCLPTLGLPQSPPTKTFTLEVYNNAPTVRVTHSGTGLLTGQQVAHNALVTLDAGAADADGSTTVTWRVVSRPPSATAALSATTGATTTIQFTGEADFGVWTLEAAVDDRQGERVTQQYTLEVINQAPRPLITVAAGGSRVRVNSNIDLLVTGDEDGGPYTSVAWEVLRPGGSWAPVGTNDRHLVVPATGPSSIGSWRFRVRVTDNETPALSGTSPEFAVDVYNDAPVVTASGPVRIRVGQPFNVNATANDPDGGPVTVRWRVIQAPTPAGAPLGVPLTALPAATRPGTWVFRAQATDDEGETADSLPVAVVVDADPVAAIEGAASMVVRAPFDLRDNSWDPDSECPTSGGVSDPFGCHSVAPGETFTPLSGALTRWTWRVDSVPAGYELFHPPGRIGESFPSVHSGYSRVLHVGEGEMPFGDYRLRVVVEDAEGNQASASVQLRILPPMVPPLAHINAPQRYLLGGSRQTLTDVVLDGSLSFDLDNALSDLLPPSPGEGITSYAWLVTPPPGCPLGPITAVTPTVRLFTAGDVVAEACMGVWSAALRVTDDDSPRLFDVRVQDFVIGRCAGEVCIDRPSHERPALVDTSSPVDVPIYYYVEPSVAARYPGGFYGIIEILPTGTGTVAYTLYDASISSRPPGTLNVVHWHGERTGGGSVTSGTYDVRVRVADLALTYSAESDVAPMSILFEDVNVNVASTSTRYSRYQDLEADTGWPGFDWTITGAISVDRVRMVIKRLGPGSVGTAFEASVAMAGTSGRFEWNGRTSTGTLLPPGDYDVRISALRGTRVLGTSAPFRTTVYRLNLGPAGSAPLAVGLNDDDDNRNGTTDSAELNVTGEDDLLPVTVSLEPATLAGTLEVFVADGGIALFNGPTKMAVAPADVSVPATPAPTYFVEGRTVGLAELALRLRPPTGPALEETHRAVSVSGVEVVDATGHPATALVPGLWDNGYLDIGGAAPLNEPGLTFVDLDPARFVVRVTDAAANLDPMRRESVSVSVGTLLVWPLAPAGAEDWADPLTLIELRETSENSGVFESESQLLTTNEEVSEPDDGFAVRSELVGGVVADEANGDRTHRLGRPGQSFLTGGVRVQYGLVHPAKKTLPVCGRTPDVRRSVNLRMRVLMEPFIDDPTATFSYTDPSGFSFNDTNGDRVHQPSEASERWVDLSTQAIMPSAGGAMAVMAGLDGRGAAATDAQLARMLRVANMSWAPACIEFRAAGPLTTLEHATITGAGAPLYDGIIQLVVDRIPLAAAMQVAPVGPTPANTIDVVVGYSLAGLVDSAGVAHTALGYTDISAASWSVGGRVGVLVGSLSALDSSMRTLAHELGHAMENADSDSPTDPAWQFYPSGGAGPGMDTNYLYRRFPHQTLLNVQTVRPFSNRSNGGNAFLQPF